MKELLKNNTTPIVIAIVVIAILVGVYFYGKKSVEDAKYLNIKTSDLNNDIANGYDPVIDAENIKMAITNTFSMIGARDEVVDAIILSKNATELKLIMNAYQAAYGENLIEALEGEWFSNFDQSIAALKQAQ